MRYEYLNNEKKNKSKSLLTIAGSDCSSGAGIQADLKTFASIGVYGSSVITSITAQNTMGVRRIYDLPTSIIVDQFESVIEDLDINFIKIGMISSTDIVLTISMLLKKYKFENVIFDPVMISESGGILLDQNAIPIIKEKLYKNIKVITPNIYEAEILSGIKIKSIEESKKAAKKIGFSGIPYVIIKGGHLKGNDLLYDSSNDEYKIYSGSFIDTEKYGYHGTGCTYSSALASYLSIGKCIEEACKLSKDFVLNGIINSIKVGNGSTPVNQFYKYKLY